MNIWISLLFLFASIGVINGLLVGLFLMAKRRNLPQQFYLGALLVALSFRIGKSVFYYFDHSVDRLILQIGLTACIFIGPMFYFYVKSIVNNSTTFRKKDIVVVSILSSIIIIGGFIYPYRNHPEIWNGYFIYYIYGVWSIFVAMGVFMGFKVLMEQYKSAGIRNFIKSPLFVVTIAVLFITITFQCALFIYGFTYIWGAIAFTIFFYYMMVNVILNKGEIDIKSKAVADPIDHADQLLLKIKSKMEEEKLYLNPKLKLNDLADAVELNRNMVSRLLNEEYLLGFSNFVNEMRVDEAMKLIHLRSDLSLEGIGYEAGFNSKSSFFSAFKKISGLTPAQFKKNMQTA